MIRRWLLFSLALVGTAILAPSVHASLIGTPLPTGPGNPAPTNVSGISNLTGATIDVSSENTQTIGSPSTLSGTLYTAVVKETNGTYDFLYQVVLNSGSDGLSRLTAGNFTGYAVSGGYTTSDTFGYFQTGTMAPDTLDHHSNSTVGFDFTGSMPGGTTSYIMVVGTNATAFSPGLVAAIDLQSLNLIGNQPFGPAGMVPEPSSLAIAGLGALGMIGYGLRRRKFLGA